MKVADRLWIHCNALIFIFVNIVNDKRSKRSICAWEEVIKAEPSLSVFCMLLNLPIFTPLSQNVSITFRMGKSLSGFYPYNSL